MTRKTLLISPDLCIGCRACRTACYAWSQTSGPVRDNRETKENISGPIPHLHEKIRYVETPFENNSTRWLFICQKCMHCRDEWCVNICPSKGALYKTREGLTVFNKEKCIGCRLCITACPFNMLSCERDGEITKCHLCYEGTTEGRSPACAKTCPTGAMRYGERDKLLGIARKAGFEKVYRVGDLEGGQGVFYAFKEVPEVFMSDEKPKIPETSVIWHKLMRPFAYAGLGGAVAASLLYHIAFGRRKIKN